VTSRLSSTARRSRRPSCVCRSLPAGGHMINGPSGSNGRRTP
jgi:hypothetical protein